MHHRTGWAGPAGTSMGQYPQVRCDMPIHWRSGLLALLLACAALLARAGHAAAEPTILVPGLLSTVPTSPVVLAAPPVAPSAAPVPSVVPAPSALPAPPNPSL